jgi:hypothetical protein
VLALNNLIMSNIEYYKNQAKVKAESDFKRRLIADHTRHNALDNSAWAVHYHRCYKEIKQLNER